jgi:hypothetical protein
MRPVRDENGTVVAIMPEAVEVTSGGKPRRRCGRRRKWKRSVS